MAQETSNAYAFVKELKTPLKSFTRDEVAQHDKPDNLYIIIDTYVLKLSSFVDMHPGGAHVLLDQSVAGKDATDVFYGLHTGDVLEKYKRLIIGQIKGESPKMYIRAAGDLSLVPHAEPTWLSKGYYSPYYSDSHRALQKAAREFYESYVKPEAIEGEATGERVSQELLKRMGSEGVELTAMRMGPGKHLHGKKLLGGVDGAEYDYFHELVIAQETARIGALSRGFQDGLLAGMWIGLTPIANYGSEQTKREIMPPVLRGEKNICLAISEAFAGSDVAGMKTTAKKSADGKHYIVNGTKKWITNGTFADYFSVGVRTSDTQLSMLLIPRTEGVETKPIKTSYSSSAGTAFVTFDDVKVPVENLLGKEGEGLKIILSNFNHERWVMVCLTARWTRTIIEQCMIWAHRRLVFGKALIQQPVIRQYLAEMISKCEALQSWLEVITYQMTKMTYAEQARNLAGPIGLLKAYATRVIHDVVDRAVQIFGGRAITKTGMGRIIEQAQRTYKFDAVLGGSEEVLFDLGVKQAMKNMPRAVL